eukprot:3736719-Prymnesium_polylepis.1
MLYLQRAYSKDVLCRRTGDARDHTSRTGTARNDTQWRRTCVAALPEARVARWYIHRPSLSASCAISLRLGLGSRSPRGVG